VIGIGGTITTIIEALGHSEKFSSVEPHFLGGSLDIATLTNMCILDTKGGTIKYPLHK